MPSFYFMRKIILIVSLLLATLGIVASLTIAFFTDEETTTGNILGASTLDIAIDSQNPWQAQFVYTGLTPGAFTEQRIRVENADPAGQALDIYKKLLIDPATSFQTGIQTWPECQEEQGTWDQVTRVCQNPQAENNDLTPVLYYSLSSAVYDDADMLIWQQTIFDEDQTLAEVYLPSSTPTTKLPIYLGMIPTNGFMEIWQGYRLATATTNWAQGDQLNFSIAIQAEQFTGQRALDNKIVDKDGAPYWKITPADNIQAELKFNPLAPTFRFDFTGLVPASLTAYSLVLGPEPWNTARLLATATSTATGFIAATGEVNLETSLPWSRVWLLPASDWGDTGMTNFQPENYLMETGLIWYQDTLINATTTPTI